MTITVKTKDEHAHIFKCDYFRIENGGLSIYVGADLIAHFRDDWSHVIQDIA